MANFEIDYLQGPLTYAITGADPDWKITKDSKDDNTDEHALETENHSTEDEAKQRLWDLKERNAIRLLATEAKKSRENREQNALLAEIGAWEPPPPPVEP